ncbi:MAG TPA: hypothetical protein DEA08_17645, partial [Planctomycetes bacterium]|nr:hypothetical protein [Planctomycetota bacterium]
MPADEGGEGRLGGRAPLIGCGGVFAVLALLGFGVAPYAKLRAVEEQRAVELHLEAELAEQGLSVDAAALIPAALPSEDLARVTDALAIVEGLSADEKELIKLYWNGAFARPPDAVEAGAHLLAQPRRLGRAKAALRASLAPIGSALDLALRHESLGLDFERVGGMVQLEDLFRVRDLILALCGRAVLAQQEGRPRQAWADLARAAEVVIALREPSLVGFNLRVAWGAFVAEAVGAALGWGPPPEGPVRARLHAALERFDHEPELSHAMRGVVLFVLDCVPAQRAEGQELWLDDSDYQLPFLGDLKWSEHRLELLRFFAEATRVARLPFLEARDGLAALEERALRGGGLSRQSFAQFSVILDLALRTRSQVRMARTALYLAEAAGAGELPHDLPDPLLGDPGSRASRPIQWRRLGPRHGRLWCVGANGSDEGGE